MPEITHALIHEARTLRTVRTSTRNAQGEYTPTNGGQPEPGPWFACRRMTKRQSSERGDSERASSRRRAEDRFTIIYGPEQAEGPLELKPADRLEVVVRGVSHFYEVDGKPELFDTGVEVFGGQAELVAVTDAA